MAAFTLDYWIEDGWYVGKLREVPGIFSQGETLEELKLNVKDAFELMLEEEAAAVEIDRQAARVRLDAVRAALAGHEDASAEQLIRKLRDRRAHELSG